VKRYFSLITPLAIVAFVLIYTAIDGSVFDLRQPPPHVSVAILRADVVRPFIDITIRNNELRPMSAEVWYTLNDPATGAILLTSERVREVNVPARSNLVISVPLPDDALPEGANIEVEPSVREIIAYLDQTPAPQLIFEGSLLPVGQGTQIISAGLEPLDAETYQLEAEIEFTGLNTGAYRYALSLIPISEDEQGNIIPGVEVYRSAFASLNVTQGTPFTETFAGEAALPPGDYTLSLWIQVASSGGGYEHFSQVTYARLLTVAE